jgi:hypothetical protein
MEDLNSLVNEWLLKEDPFLKSEAIRAKATLSTLGIYLHNKHKS